MAMNKSTKPGTRKMNASAPRRSCGLLVLLTLLGGCANLPFVPARETTPARPNDTAGKTAQGMPQNTQAIDALKVMGPGLGILILR